MYVSATVNGEPHSFEFNVNEGGLAETLLNQWLYDLKLNAGTPDKDSLVVSFSE